MLKLSLYFAKRCDSLNDKKNSYLLFQEIMEKQIYLWAAFGREYVIPITDEY